MSWTWSGNPANSDLDAVRFWVQDTDTTFQLISDEEINFLLTTYMPRFGSTVAVAAITAEVIAARFAREVDVSADGVSVRVGDLHKRYNELAESLRAQYRSNEGDLSASLDDMFSDVSVGAIEPLVFGVGFMDNYRVGQQDYGYFSPGTAPWYAPDGAAPEEALTRSAPEEG